MTSVNAVITGLIIWSIYAAGISRGMDHVLAHGAEIDITPISIVLTESVYGIDLGYVGLRSVYGTMMNVVSRDAKRPDDPIVLRNIRDREVIEEAIAAGSSLSVSAMSYGYFSDRSLITMMYQDLGSVDYIKLSFNLFGRRIEALYYTFILILAVSAVLFLVTFPNSITAQLVLLAALFAFRLELSTSIFTRDMPTFATVRHGSTLALIPVWYFALLTRDKRKVSWLSLVLAAGQLVILVFAITIRSTAIWAVVFLGALAVVCGSYRWLAAASADRTFRAWLRQVTPWPVIALVVALTIHGQYTRMKLHPVYFTDEMLPYHPLWHSAYLGFRYLPELYGFPVPEELIGADLLAFNAAVAYARSVHFMRNDTNSPLADGYFGVWNGGVPKWRLHDQLMRRIVLQIAARHPWKTIYLLAWKKPVAILRVAVGVVQRFEQRLKPLMLSGGLVAGLLMIVFGGRKELLAATRLVPVGMGAVAVSILPCVWAYPTSWTVADGLLLALGTAVVAIGILVALTYYTIRTAILARVGIAASPPHVGMPVSALGSSLTKTDRGAGEGL